MNFVEYTGAAVEDGLRLVTVNPAAMAGLESVVAVDRAANLVAVDAAGRLVASMVDGRLAASYPTHAR
jgi:N-acetylglucosamine-6-phosphate deacetylase